MTRTLITLFVAASCGGIAVIDGDGTSSASASSSNTSSSSSSSSASAGGGSVNPLCTQACALTGSCLLSSAPCVAACTEENCVAQHDALLSCLLDEQNPDFLCDLPDPCVIRVQQYTNCLGSGVFTGDCAMGSCECLYSDQRGNSLQTQCSGSGCDCILNGTPIGSCESFDNGCDPLLDCCAALFFVASPLQ